MELQTWCGGLLVELIVEVVGAEETMNGIWVVFIFLLVQMEMGERQWEEVGKCDVRVGPGVVFSGVFEKKGERVMVVFFSSLLFLFKEKLVQGIGLCFEISFFYQWISPLFIGVEREVWSVYLA